MYDESVGEAVDEECAYGHGCLELECLPVGLVEGDGGGVVGYGGSDLCALGGALFYGCHEESRYGYLTFGGFGE